MSKRNLQIILSFLIFILPSILLAQSYHISDIVVEGTSRIDPELVKETVTVKPGKIKKEDVTASIKAVYDLGDFEKVSAEVRTKSGRSILVIKVVERVAVRKVFVVGNEAADEEDLSEVLKFEEKRYLDPVQINGMLRSAEVYYQTLGYYDAKFDYSVVEVEDGQVDITFSVDEGKRYKIEEVRIIASNEDSEVDTDDLADEIETQEYSWWSSWIMGTGRLNQAHLEADKTIILQYLLDRGFINAKVSDADINKEGEGLIITYQIEEGDQFKLGTYTASGDLINDSLEETLDLLDLEEGEIFNAGKMRQQAFMLSDEYGDYGYAFANVIPNTKINAGEKTVDLDFQLSKGKLVSVNEINIRGNSKTFDNVIRRELKIQEQETYSSTKVKRSQALLRRLGYFNDVSIAPENITGVDDKVNLNVDVQEASTGTFSIGGGFSSSDGALFNASLGESNFLGTGRRVRLNADLGDRRENLILSLDDRRFNDSYWRVGSELLRTEREFTDFDRRISGGNFTIGYPLEEFFGKWSEDIDVSLRYQYWDVNIFDVDPNDAAQFVIDSEGSATASGLVPRLVRNTIDNPLNPTEGSRQTLTMEFTGLGGSEEYYMAEFRNQMFFPLFDMANDKFVFSWRVNVGFGETYDGDPFPLFRRFFPGGINSMRGFEERTLGPKDDRGNEFGGSKQFVNNLEVIFPLVASAGLKGVLFYDIGNAFDDEESIEFGEMREAVGFGFRWNSPLGPFRIEIGYPLDKEEGEDSVVTLFSFGSPIF